MKPLREPAFPPKLWKGFLTEEETSLLKAWAETETYRAVPSWLGNFEFRLFGDAYGRNHGKLPEEIRPIALKLAAQFPTQQFTTCFVQRYGVGAQVAQHRDPKNNTGWTTIAVFGEFTGALTRVEKWGSFQLNSGDACALPCTIDGRQGPAHQVSEVLSGTRYALILNTIE